MKKLVTQLSIIVGLLTLAGCGKEQAPQENPDKIALRELINKTNQALADKSDDLAMSFLEKLIQQYPDLLETQNFRLTLARMYQDLEQYESAYRCYKDYTRFYPNDDRAEFAYYQAILSRYYQTLRMRAECDTTEALKTIKLCDKYLKSLNYSSYATDVADIKKTCQKRIINKEIYIFNNCLLQGKLQAAQTRLNLMKEELLPQHPDLEPELVFLSCKLAHAQKNPDEKTTHFKTLQESYPDSSYTKMAQGLMKNGLFS